MSGGVGAALDQALGDAGDAGELDAEAVQLDMLADPAQLGPEETGALDVASPLSAALAPRAAGRPRGARNRRTEAVAAWLLSQHRHPLSVMMEAYSMTPAALAERIGLVKPDLLEVFKLQMRMAEACAPYLAQRQPLAVNVAGQAALTVAFAGVSLPARGGSAAGPAAAIAGPLALDLPFKSGADSRMDD